MATRTGFLTVGLALLALTASAQDDSAGFPLGGFDNHGSVTAGYRFTDVKGYQPMYLELMNLQTGFRLQDFDLYGDSQQGAVPFADSYSLTASGLGGDPFPSAQLTVTKNKLYDFRVNWRQSYYYWNQNDNVLLPITAPAGLSEGLTNNHDWATVRKFGSADLTLHATNNLRFHFNYYRTTDDGTLFTTRSLDFFDSPSFWGTFARGNPYYLFAPLSDNTNRFSGGIDYTWRAWNFHYTAGYQTFSEVVTFDNVTSPEVSINAIPSSLTTPLSDVSWTQLRRLTTPISEFSFVGKATPKLEWRGGYIFYRYQGPASLDQSFNGTAPGSTGALAAYNVSEGARASVTEPNNVINQGLTYHVNTWWDVDLDYKYSRFTTNSVGDFQSLYDGATPAAGQSDIAWKDGTSEADLSLSFIPFQGLSIHPGIQFLKSDVEALQNGVADPALTLRTKTVRPEIAFSYQPANQFSIRGDFHTFTSGASYTAITPHTETGAHFILRYQPVAKLSFEDDLRITDDRLAETGFQNNVRSNGLTVSYAFGDRFSVFSGFAYDSTFAAGDILYARGTAPLNDFLRDQEVNRVWQAGIEGKPAKRVGLRFSGNFVRSSGVGQISGEPPAYGPLTWPLATATAYYDFPKAGRLSLDLQRTYYVEQIVTANNFSANLLTILWTREF